MDLYSVSAIRLMLTAFSGTLTDCENADIKLAFTSLNLVTVILGIVIFTVNLDFDDVDVVGLTVCEVVSRVSKCI